MLETSKNQIDATSYLKINQVLDSIQLTRFCHQQNLLFSEGKKGGREEMFISYNAKRRHNQDKDVLFSL